MRPPLFVARASAAGAMLAILLVPGPMAHAAILGTTFDVTSTADASDALIDGTCATAAVPPVCTLRAAIQEANATVEDDIINVPAGKYTLKLVGAGEDAAATGDLDITNDVTIAGAGATSTIIKGKKDRVFQVVSGATVIIRDLTISKGKVGKKGDVGQAFDGGGIVTEGPLALERVVLSGNTAASEGGGVSCADSTLILTDVTVASNKALGDDGGGVDLDNCAGTLTRVTISKNKAPDEGGGLNATDPAVTTLTNCTVSGNKAEQGGGIRNQEGATLTLTNVTVTGNKAKDGSGGIDPDAALTVTLQNVILNKNKPDNCGDVMNLQGGNLETGSSCGLGPAESNIAKMGLAGLKSNGGATKTHALKAGSPAIDAGINANCPATDQRGQARVDVAGVGTVACDSGAFEFVPAP